MPSRQRKASEKEEACLASSVGLKKPCSHQALEQLPVLLPREGDCHAAPACPGGASHAVHVGGDVAGGVEVDHAAHANNVKALTEGRTKGE